MIEWIMYQPQQFLKCILQNKQPFSGLCVCVQHVQIKKKQEVIACVQSYCGMCLGPGQPLSGSACWESQTRLEEYRQCLGQQLRLTEQAV